MKTVIDKTNIVKTKMSIRFVAFLLKKDVVKSITANAPKTSNNTQFCNKYSLNASISNIILLFFFLKKKKEVFVNRIQY